MPPKRKAPTNAVESVQTRRRTRATAPDEDGAEPAVPELPPAKRTRRRANAEDGAASTETQKKPVAQASTSVARTSRTTRVATRSRKAEVGGTQVIEQPQPSVPKRRGKTTKTQDQPEVGVVERDDEIEVEPPRPLRPVNDTVSQGENVPKNRGRPKNTQVAPDLVGVEHPRPQRTRRTKFSVEAGLASSSKIHVSGPEPPTETIKTRAGRKPVASALKPESQTVSTTKRGPPSPKAKPRLTVQEEVHTSESEDELLLKPSRPAPQPSSIRPSTPARKGPSRVGTPRMVMISVEIPTPKRLLHTIRRGSVSPGPRVYPSAHIPPEGTPRLPAAFPSSISPSKRNTAAPRPYSSGPRPARTPSPHPSAPRIATLYPPESPSRTPRRTRQKEPEAFPPTEVLPNVLPDHLRPLLERQKRAVLRTLSQSPEIDEIDVYGEDYPPTNTAAFEQLGDLLTGTVVRGEGNSCLLIGPSGSGKTQMVERVIASLPGSPIVVRLSGYAQHNDRLAIREIAWQLAQQTGRSLLPDDPEDEDVENGDAAADIEAPAPARAEPDVVEDEDEENPFVVEPTTAPPLPGAMAVVVALPPPAHLLALISMIPTLPRPTVVVLDGFDLFAGHARQALLYCLLDTAQACRAGTGAGCGMAVVGVTARVDTINLLEKRVKSRFSGRMIRTACPAKLEHWVALTRGVLGAPVLEPGPGAQARGGDSDKDKDKDEREWARLWARAVERFVEEAAVVDALRETYALSRDFQMFRRIMTCLTMELKGNSPYPTLSKLKLAMGRQRCPPRYPPLHTLPYPAICLLIASVHAQTTGHDVFTFEMLHDAFKSQVRASQSAPVQIEGGSIGMVRCSREVLFAAFEQLVNLHIFLPAAAASGSISKEFVLHRSAVDRFAVKKAVETVGQLNLKKWFSKG